MLEGRLEARSRANHEETGEEQHTVVYAPSSENRYSSGHRKSTPSHLGSSVNTTSSISLSLLITEVYFALNLRFLVLRACGLILLNMVRE